MNFFRVQSFFSIYRDIQFSGVQIIETGLYFVHPPTLTDFHRRLSSVTQLFISRISYFSHFKSMSASFCEERGTLSTQKGMELMEDGTFVLILILFHSRTLSLLRYLSNQPISTYPLSLDNIFIVFFYLFLFIFFCFSIFMYMNIVYGNLLFRHYKLEAFFHTTKQTP